MKCRVLVVGTGPVGQHTVKQLAKNQSLRIVWAGPPIERTEEWSAVAEFINLKQASTPANIKELVEEVEPGVVLLCQTVEDWQLENFSFGDVFLRAMLSESTRTGPVPILLISSDQT